MKKTEDLNLYTMAPQRRELLLRVVDGTQDLQPITTALYFLDQHFPQSKLDRALAWFILMGITGKHFLPWFRHECKSSHLEMHRLLLSIIDRKDQEQLVAGRNFHA